MKKHRTLNEMQKH